MIPPPAATIDVPSCSKLRNLTAAAAPTAARTTSFFWAGRAVPLAHRLNPMYGDDALNVREILMRHAGSPGFQIVNTYPGAKAGGSKGGNEVSVGDWMRQSVFCGVPPGQRYGDARRHLLAAFLGCVPVLMVPDGHHTLEEVLPWREMAINVSPEDMPRLPDILRAVTPPRLERMRRKLRCARRLLWYASMYGACAPWMGRGSPDAFDGLMRTLASRLSPTPARPRRASQFFDDCSE